MQEIGSYKKSAEYKFDKFDDEEPGKEDGAEVEEEILKVQQEILNSTDLTPENSNTLNEIFDLARATYEKDSEAWDELFENLISEIASADDDEAADILHQYSRKADALG